MGRENNNNQIQYPNFPNLSPSLRRTNPVSRVFLVFPLPEQNCGGYPKKKLFCDLTQKVKIEEDRNFRGNLKKKLMEVDVLDSSVTYKGGKTWENWGSISQFLFFFLQNIFKGEIFILKNQTL